MLVVSSAVLVKYWPLLSKYCLTCVSWEATNVGQYVSQLLVNMSTVIATNTQTTSQPIVSTEPDWQLPVNMYDLKVAFQLSIIKTKPKKWSQHPIRREENANKNLHLKQTNCLKLVIGSRFSSDWFKKQCKFSGPITERSKSKPRQSLITLNTLSKMCSLHLRQCNSHRNDKQLAMT